MKIVKKYQGTLPKNKIVSTKINSDTDTYSCNYINERLEGVVIYSGDGNPPVYVSEPFSNFKYIEIFYEGDGGNNCSCSQRVFNNYGNSYTSLFSSSVNGYSSFFIWTTFVNLSGSEASYVYSSRFYVNNNSIGGSNQSRYNSIKRIIGYR